MTAAITGGWTVPDDLRFRTTEYVVDASHEESFAIWHRWSHLYGAPFEQDNMGHCSQIGLVADRPIVVNVFWYIVADLFRVAFVDGCSQLVDHKMIEDWQKAVFPCLSIPGAWRHSDAANFGNLLGDMGRRMGREGGLLTRSPSLVDKALKMIDDGKIK